jgi:hypothetical protein
MRGRVDMAKVEPINVQSIRRQLRERLEYLEEQIAPLQEEADEIRAMLSEGRGGSAEETRAALLDAVRRAPGRAGAEYDSMLRLGDGQAVRLLKALEAEGLIRREGQRRGTRWFPRDQS